MSYVGSVAAAAHAKCIAKTGLFYQSATVVVTGPGLPAAINRSITLAAP